MFIVLNGFLPDFLVNRGLPEIHVTGLDEVFTRRIVLSMARFLGIFSRFKKLIRVSK
jgi:hypothetical protein